MEERKERQEIKVKVDCAKTLKLFRTVIVVLIAQRGGHQQVDVIQEVDVLEEDVVTGGEVVGLKQMVGGDMMTALMNMR